MIKNKWGEVLLTSKKDDWETPQSLFNELDSKYHFVGDLAATAENAKCDRYISPEQNSLSKDWKEFGGAEPCF